ncbi:alpha/beta hydrolase domain-containing protein [Piscinibacter sakaiensis]|uniref:alpha/beta hydrolase domain-containing protein n=1 Tax=Piscinibacter sakaiensis TaxID=1547922 RepID=UPI00372CEA30
MAALLLGTALGLAVPAQARVTRIVIDARTTVTGQALAYEQIRGRAFGELDPADAKNAVVTDIALGVSADGKLRYEVPFSLTKPVDLSAASGFLWHDVPNRGGNVALGVVERGLGDIGLVSGWQADNAGSTVIPADRATGTNFWAAVPMARQGGQLVTGKVLGRIINQSGVASQPLVVSRASSPIPYLPASLDTTQATLTIIDKETVDGKVTVGGTVPSGDWAFARCDAANPFPGTPIDIDPAKLPSNLPVHVCVKGGFQAGKLYQVVYTGTNAYVLGAGLAAFRDVGSFFRYAQADDAGTPNPIASAVKGSAVRGVSQSGNMIRQLIYLGMNQDEANRRVYDGAWPQIAGRRVSANSRFALPDGTLELYQMGSEGAQWWVDWADTARGLPTRGIFTRCSASNTCPKVFEHFGSSEVYALKMTTEWVGTGADVDIPVTRNVRRYYVGSTTHGGGGGGFVHLPATTTGASCPGNNYGRGTLLANPVPLTQLINVLRLAMRDWVLQDKAPPPSRYPTLIGGTLVEPTQAAMGFPSGVPGIPASTFLPENFVWPVFDYDWGSGFNHADATGVPTQVPPTIKKVIPMRVPKVDADGNELGGVPTVLTMAPLGTYLGWNIGAAGFFAGQVCNYVGGYVPFARTRAERQQTGDPRPSLEERYVNHAGYVAAVREAARKAFEQGFLLAADRDSLVQAAEDSTVLK